MKEFRSMLELFFLNMVTLNKDREKVVYYGKADKEKERNPKNNR